jgi:hypothetical protein
MALVKNFGRQSSFRLNVPGKAYVNDVVVKVTYHPPSGGGSTPLGQWDGVGKAVIAPGATNSDTLHIRVNCTDERSTPAGTGETAQVDVSITDTTPVGSSQSSTETVNNVGIIF